LCYQVCELIKEPIELGKEFWRIFGRTVTLLNESTDFETLPQLLDTPLYISAKN